MNDFLLTPLDAWHNDILRAYVFIIGGCLAGAGAILSLLTYGLKKDVKNVWIIYRSWLIMIALLVVAILGGRIPLIIVFTLIAILGAKEFSRATGLYKDWWMTGALYLAIIAIGITSIVKSPSVPQGPAGWYGLFMTLPVYAIALFILIPILRNKTEGQLQSLALTILGYVYIGWMFLHVAFLANAPVPTAYGYLLYLLFAVEVNDIAAFTFGKLLGKPGRHPLRSNISPKKTWEGSLGALAVSMALPWIMHFSFPHFGTTQLILTGLIVGIGGQLGDLSISLIKIDIGIKDMGALIPGHGGVLDRIDSLIYTGPLFLHMVDYYYKIW